MVEEEPRNKVETIIEGTRYSSLTKLLHITAFVLKFIAKPSNRMKSQENRELILKELTASDINNSEIVSINSFKLSSFETEMKYHTQLNRKMTIPKFMAQFGLYLDLRDSLMSNSKHPILLPSRNHFVALLIQHTRTRTHEHCIAKGYSRYPRCVKGTF